MRRSHRSPPKVTRSDQDSKLSEKMKQQEEQNALKELFKDRENIVEKSLFQLPFAYPQDMKLYYQKYGLSQRGVAPFYDSKQNDNYNYDKEIQRLLLSNVDKLHAKQMQTRQQNGAKNNTTSVRGKKKKGANGGIQSTQIESVYEELKQQSLFFSEQLRQ